MRTNEHEQVIEVTDLRRVYTGGFEAVRGVSFSARRGEVFALLGTNGAGKTSTVELLEGLAAPTGGQVRIFGQITEHGPAGRDVDEAVAGILLIVPAFGAGIVALGVRNRLRVLALAAGATLGSLPFGMPAPATLTVAAVVLFGGGFVAFTSVFSVRLLNAVYELDEARETRTRLAVAEERLRFGRDLHDVMGRNLAVIALKSELAVQLAQRERPEAVAQMVEVQRLAHEAQREVREVVRGYREADLRSELAGAKGVLDAAGIDCTVTGPTTGLPAQVQSALGWVVREAATNVLRHGNARWCAVGIRVLKGRTVLTVENDGVPENGGSGQGSGLVGLRERLAEMGGPCGRARPGTGGSCSRPRSRCRRPCRTVPVGGVRPRRPHPERT
ncbi:hypothetical protein SHIRM173S_08166 [Streptomyces hirsutus]